MGSDFPCMGMPRHVAVVLHHGSTIVGVVIILHATRTHTHNKVFIELWAAAAIAVVRSFTNNKAILLLLIAVHLQRQVGQTSLAVILS